ncbi:MAG TPA: ATP synthase F1 subunit gamma [Candidatus Saccharimonadales bacterium]|nr:ATP synthase F1 subunit gamma [Candidatus Saccharimonadales bacterium]
MANTITLKRRIGSVKNTKQITKAMELVAASKMRRAQEYALAGRVYREFAYSLLTRLSAITEVNEHPLFVQRTVKSRLYVVITSNGTLAGAYNANIIRMLTRAILADQKEGIKTQVIAIGKQGAKFARRVQGIDLLAAYTEIPDHPEANDVRSILDTAIEMYRSKNVDDVKVLYTQFKSNLAQEATALSLLPARFDATEEVPNSLSNTTFEPSIEAVLDSVSERLLEVQVWQALLESLASEHSMRMMAMKNATDNATDLIDDLTLAFNTARQAAITQELAEITGGAEAIQK